MLRASIDYVCYAAFVPPAASISPDATLSHITNSPGWEDAFTTGNSEADHMLYKLPEKYTNVDSLALATECVTEIATPEGLETPQIRNTKSVAANLVQEPSSLTEAQVLDEISHTTVNSSVPELNDRFSEAISLLNKAPAAVSDDMKGSYSMEEETSRDNATLFGKSPQRDASGFLVPFAKQGIVVLNTRMQMTEIEYPTTTRVLHAAPIVSQDAVMANEHVEEDM